LKGWSVSPNNYFPYTQDLTNALEFSDLTGHIGEDVVVAIIDDGVSANAFAVGSRVIGGENFTLDGIPATSDLNDPHGTWVACCVGANGIFGFGDPAVQNAVKMNLPDAVIPDFFAPGIDGIPMVGQAPGALFYALKVFPAGGGSAPFSVIAAAFERAIELKQMYNKGEAGGVNIRVVNMSIGGVSLFAGNHPLFAPLGELAIEAGILVVVSASNDGPAGMSIGNPGDTKNILTVGASDDAVYERILLDFLIPGYGELFRPLLNHQTALFSSRGPTADGRIDPELVAPGTWRFVQHANGTNVNWVSGTSFSAPTVSGAAALLCSTYPEATPHQLRAALMKGANPYLLDDRSHQLDQGKGFLDVIGAQVKLEEGRGARRDQGPEGEKVARNIRNFVKIIPEQPYYSVETKRLLPGQCYQIYYDVQEATRMRITISDVTPELPDTLQNLLFGDDLYVTIHSAKTSGFSDYRAFTPAFVGPSGAVFTLGASDLETGIMRITVCGDWTNAGRVSANVTIETEPPEYMSKRLGKGYLMDGQADVYTVNVKDDVTALHLKLEWMMNWARYPTNDLDILVFDPNGDPVFLDNDFDFDFDGVSLDSPERMDIYDPLPGLWTFVIDGFTIWEGEERYKFYLDMDRLIPLSKELAGLNAVEELTPQDFHIDQNYPNPFNPVTTIEYQLPEEAQVQLNVYNIQGQVVRTLINDRKPAGYYSTVWDGKDRFGRSVPSGTYIYRINAGEYTKAFKMVLTK
jgi:hypothetical protein